MMMTAIILTVLIVYVVQLFLQEMSLLGVDRKKLLGNRDSLPEHTVVSARLERAKNNMMEALPIFLGLALLAIIKDGDDSAATTGALVFLVTRILYVPAYASGIRAVRSILWTISLIGLLMMALTLV
ncbi:MAG: MAPEG family protein [Parasphingorhabdus sp.]|uniref:MAPEG family protein n=1 Tax=Parasphingorhabdus sp. TaxID=2709688 RepID=UPI003297E671